MPKSNVTISSIARILDVSPSTVSRALAKKKGVSDGLKDRIVSVANELNYHPNMVARSLRTKVSKEIGLIIPDNSNPFFSAMVRGIDTVAHELGYTLLLISTNNDTKIEREAILKFNELQVAGLISVPSDISNYGSLSLPLVFLTRCNDVDSKFNYIVTDDIEGSYLATRNLITSGLSAYFFVCDSLDVISSKNRLTGYQKALFEAGISPKDEWILTGVNTIPDGYRIFQEIYRRSVFPIGILCHNDYTAIGVVKSVSDSNLRHGVDVRIIGYDDIELISYITPALSTVRQVKFDIGAWGARHLINLIESDSSEKPLHMIMKPELVIRDT